MSYKKNLYAGLSLMIFSAAYLALSLDIKPFTGAGATPLDSTFVPRLWGVCLFLLSAALTVRGWREFKKNKEEGGAADAKADQAGPKKQYRKVALTFLLIAIYILLLEKIGFILMSALFMFTLALVLSPKGKVKPVTAAIVAVVAAVFIDYLFVVLLHVLLPTGILGF